MTVQEAIAKIHSVYPNGRKNGLNNMRALAEKLHDPQNALAMVHVAGTNGKGSCCAMIESILRAAGLRTGLYTSPYIEVYNERIRLCGVPISDELLVALVERVEPEVLSCAREGIHVTEFELGTALAFCAFAEERTDIAVIETGLGGRLDPTNIISPKVCAITQIGMDHMAYLGDTIEAIAGEKAGIIKRGVPVSIAPQEARARGVLIGAAERMGAPLIELRAEHITETRDFIRFDVSMGDERLTGLRVALRGRHQADNACAALGAILSLRTMGWDIPERAVREGLSRVRWPGRLERLGQVLLDGAHNDPGVQALCDYADRWLVPEQTVLLTGMMADKETRKMAAKLAPRVCRVVCAAPNVPRAMSARELAETFKALGAAAEAAQSVEDGLNRARALAGADGTVLAAGSLYLIGEVRALLRREGIVPCEGADV